MVPFAGGAAGLSVSAGALALTKGRVAHER